MNWEMILQVTIPLFAVLGWMWSQMQKKFDGLHSEFREIRLELTDIRNQITDLKVSVGKLETRVEERTLRVVHVDKTGTKDQ